MKAPPIIRFFSKVELSEACWEWSAYRNKDGYGTFRVGSRTDGTRRMILAHQFAYETLVGPVPDGFQLDHLCRNRGCVNPTHLEVVTNQENSSRGETGKYLSRRTHCIRGHSYSEENTYIRPDGRRSCRICHRDALRRWRKRIKETR